MTVKKIIRYGFRGLIWVGTILLVLWIAILVYIHFNKSRLIDKITSKITNKTKSEAHIGNLSASFFRTFPYVSLHLSDVTIKDSLWKQHNKTFFTAKEVYLRFNLFSLFNKHPSIDKFLVENGKMHFLSDSTGFNNQYILRSDKKTEKNNFSIPDVLLKKIEIIFENPVRHKLHRLKINKLTCNHTGSNNFRKFSINTDMLVNSLAFNTQKGSYLKNKNLKGKFQVVYNQEKKQLLFSNIVLQIDGERFNFTGNFSVDTSSRDYKLTIRSPKIDFQKTIALLPDSLQKKLKAYTIEKPVAFLVNITGKTIYKFKPLVQIDLTVNNNVVSTPAATLTNCSFTGEFVNEVIRGQPRSDTNSALTFTNFSAQLQKINFSSKQIKVINLQTPYLEFDLKSVFNLTSLNELTGSSTIQFLKGTGDVNIIFKGPLAGQDTISSVMDGEIKIKSATIKYLPRSFTFSKCSGTFLLQKNDLHIRQFAGWAGDTELLMDGDARNFLSLLDISPEKLTLTWKVRSPHIYLKDFQTFLARKKLGETSKAVNAKFKSIAGKIDRMFTEGDMYFTITTPKINYKKFEAENVNAQVLLTKNKIDLKNASLLHANGSMIMQGTVTEESGSNGVAFNARMNKMNIPSLFYAFENFGQDAVTHKNLKGVVSATANIYVAVTEEVKVKPQSMMGTIDFLVENGELNHFEPLEKISASVFNKQDFSSIRFAALKNRLEVKGTAITINKMEIRSTALVLSAEGVYDVKKGTDLSIKFPIKNMMKKNDSINLIKKDVRHGISVHVRAKTGPDGKLKISWDPFRRAVRNKKETGTN